MHFITSLGTLHSIIQGILIEGKVEDLQKKYPNLDVKEISRYDPTEIHKYLPWMCKQLNKGASENDLYPTVIQFDKNVQRFKKRDINQYTTLRELEDEVKALPRSPSKSQEKQQAKEGSHKLLETDQLLVLRIDTREACQVYGANTKWCITMKDASYFEQYTGHNVVFYFIIDKTKERENSLHKVAVAVMRDKDNKVQKMELYSARDTKINAKKFVAVNTSLPDIIEHIKTDAAQQPMGLIARIMNGEATTQEIETLLFDPKTADETRAHVLNYARGNMSPKLLATLAQSKNEKIRRAVAADPNTPNETLMTLVDDKDASVRFAMAQNIKTSSQVLDRLVNDDSVDVRRAVAILKTTSAKALSQLADDEDTGVCVNVASNHNTPAEVLTRLLNRHSTDVGVRLNVANNPNTPREVLAQLSTDPHEYVRNSALKRVKS